MDRDGTYAVSGPDLADVLRPIGILLPDITKGGAEAIERISRSSKACVLTV